MKLKHADEQVVKAHDDAQKAHDSAALKLRENAKAAVAAAIKKNTKVNAPVVVKPVAKCIKPVPKVIIVPAHIPELHPTPTPVSSASSHDASGLVTITVSKVNTHHNETNNSTNSTSLAAPATTLHQAKNDSNNASNSSAQVVATPVKPAQIAEEAIKPIPAVKLDEMEGLTEEERWILSMPESVIEKEHGPMKFSNVGTKQENM